MLVIFVVSSRPPGCRCQDDVPDWFSHAARLPRAARCCASRASSAGGALTTGAGRPGRRVLRRRLRHLGRVAPVVRARASPGCVRTCSRTRSDPRRGIAALPRPWSRRDRRGGGGALVMTPARCASRSCPATASAPRSSPQAEAVLRGRGAVLRPQRSALTGFDWGAERYLAHRRDAARRRAARCSQQEFDAILLGRHGRSARARQPPRRRHPARACASSSTST